MTDYISVNYEKGGVKVNLSVDCDDNLPYNLAELFRRIIEDSNANPQLVFQQLSYDYPIKWEEE